MVDGKLLWKNSLSYLGRILKNGQSIVLFLLNAGVGGKTPWEMFYDCKTRRGFLETYARGKRFRTGLSSILDKKRFTFLIFCGLFSILQ